MLQPKRTKYRKQQKGRNSGLAQNGNRVTFGDFGLKAVEHGQINSRQQEAARRAATRYIKRGGEITMRPFPDTPITRKPLETRMGSGKGSVEYYVIKVKPGVVLMEMSGVEKDIAKAALTLAAAKLPIKTVFVEREIM